ncbi:hypothetical protein LJK88_16440 [Paenibacillus sp. P26]|nr:hypothetical protein LJK88_16440 [Paenibacillus sp. P26]UUZ96607.1 hypothetical protein LJK87_21350 [Paenibacillus sp. P25]
MKRSYLGVILLCLVVFVSIVCTQQVVNNFFYERYVRVLVFAGVNVVLFPVALWIYRKERDSV